VLCWIDAYETVELALCVQERRICSRKQVTIPLCIYVRLAHNWPSAYNVRTLWRFTNMLIIINIIINYSISVFKIFFQSLFNWAVLTTTLPRNYFEVTRLLGVAIAANVSVSPLIGLLYIEVFSTQNCY